MKENKSVRIERRDELVRGLYLGVTLGGKSNVSISKQAVGENNDCVLPRD